MPVLHFWGPYNVLPGEIARPQGRVLSHRHFIQHLVRHMAAPRFKLEQLLHTWVALDQLRIKSVEDVTEQLSVATQTVSKDITKFVKDMFKY